MSTSVPAAKGGATPGRRVPIHVVAFLAPAMAIYTVFSIKTEPGLKASKPVTPTFFKP